MDSIDEVEFLKACLTLMTEAMRELSVYVQSRGIETLPTEILETMKTIEKALAARYAS